MKFSFGISTLSVDRLVRVACWFALAALSLMGCSILWPKPLLVIAAMSIGHVLGGAAFICYLLAILLDATRAGRAVEGAPRIDKESS